MMTYGIRKAVYAKRKTIPQIAGWFTYQFFWNYPFFTNTDSKAG
jgi:hypothetical protein